MLVQSNVGYFTLQPKSELIISKYIVLNLTVYLVIDIWGHGISGSVRGNGEIHTSRINDTIINIKMANIHKCYIIKEINTSTNMITDIKEPLTRYWSPASWALNSD